jgi:type I restriction enzyme, R subunit
VSGSPTSEDSLVEQPALEALQAAGWTHVHGRQLAADGSGAERSRWSDVVLAGRMREAIERLNPELPPQSVQRACAIVLASASPAVIEDHKGFHELLLSGVPISYVDGDGVERHDHARLVDFEDTEANEFLVVNQLTIIVGAKNRRPDLLLYVNGLPLGQIELKAPGGKSMAEVAVNQIAHYRDTIPGLYRYVEIVGVSDLLRARVGTSTTPVEHFSEWKTMASENPQSARPQLQLMIDGVFTPARFLELARDFVFFETDGARTWKVLAKYHQVDAVHAAVESARKAMNGDGKGGIVWHTQGAGKSYTMVFFANKLRRDPRFGNPTIVAVTDRTDLDNQLADTFTGTHLAAACHQAEEITGGPRSLHQLLRVPAGGIVFTTIQKFAPERGVAEMPVLSERRNIIVIADEAHRSQYKTFAENITFALPNAIRIGFTGTPVEKADRSTRLVFGDYVSVYRMRQAQEDGATVPIYYESRQIPIEIENPEELANVEEVLEAEETEAASKLVTSWAKLEKVVGAPDRLVRLADDLVAHYQERCDALEGKAMVVAFSRRIAAEVTELLRARLDDDAVECIISAAATDPPEISRFRRSKAELKDVAKRFRDPDDRLRIVVVRDMWLTGFDAPVLHTLYVDKTMRDHGLLQAIARVNRVFRDKPGGLVVDYIGIGEDLRASLTAYDQTEIDEPVILAARAVAGLWEKYEVIAAMLHPIGFRPGELRKATNPHELLLDAYNLILESEQKTQELLDAQAALARWYALARTQPAAIEIRDDVAFFNLLAAEVRAIASPESQASGAAEQAVKQFFSEGLAAGEVLDVFGIAAKDRPEISVLSDEFLDSIASKDEHRNVQRRLLEKLIDDEIRGRARTNQMQAKQFGEEVRAVLRRYEQKQLTSAEIVERLVEIAKRLRESRRRHEQLGLSPEEAAFYDALAGGAQDVEADPKLAEVAHELVEMIRRDLTIDWADREATEAKIRARIKRVLRKRRDVLPTPPPGGGGKPTPRPEIDDVAQLILDQAKALYRYWPESAARDDRAMP